jgi:hypothetical protein
MTEFSTDKKQHQINHDKLEALKDICQTDLRGRIEILAGLTQEFILAGCEAPFIAAVIKDDHFYFLPVFDVRDPDHAEALKKKVLDMAADKEADCIVVAHASWIAWAFGGLRPALSPFRKEILVVVGKDRTTQLMGSQSIHRNGGEIELGDMDFTSEWTSWLDDFPARTAKVATC